ncbi:hypothetical protein [Microcoleus asticus]
MASGQIIQLAIGQPPSDPQSSGAPSRFRLLAALNPDPPQLY